MTGGPGHHDKVPALPEGWSIGRFDVELDLDGVLAVDLASFTNPWTREMHVGEARESDMSRVHVLKAPSGTVVGYCSAWLVRDELHINNLAIHPDWRRQGLASALLRAVLASAVGEGAVRATLEVRSTNMPARLLYEGVGFKPAGVRRDYYTNPVDDALVLWLELVA